MENDNIEDLEKLSTDLADVPTLENQLDESEVLDAVEQKLEPDSDELLEPEEIGEVLHAMAEDFAPNWQLSEKVCNRLGRPYAKVLNKLIGKSSFKYKDEVIALVLTLVVVAPRLGVPRHGELIEAHQDDLGHG